MSELTTQDAVEAVEAAIKGAAPTWAIEIAYGGDVQTWLESERVTGPTVLIVIAGDEPDNERESGKVRRWREHYDIFMRARVPREQMKSVRAEYKAVREALNGLEYLDSDGGHLVSVSGGRMDNLAGVIMPQLQLIVR